MVPAEELQSRGGIGSECRILRKPELECSTESRVGRMKFARNLLRDVRFQFHDAIVAP